MNRQLLFQNNNSKSLFNKTCRLTNSMNSIGLKAFNNWGGITYEDILNNYPKEIVEKCWNVFSRCVIENYLGGKGTFNKYRNRFRWHDKYKFS